MTSLNKQHMQTKLNHFSKCIVKKKMTPVILNKHNEGFFFNLIAI